VSVPRLYSLSGSTPIEGYVAPDETLTVKFDDALAFGIRVQAIKFGLKGIVLFNRRFWKIALLDESLSNECLALPGLPDRASGPSGVAVAVAVVHSLSFREVRKCVGLLPIHHPFSLRFLRSTSTRTGSTPSRARPHRGEASRREGALGRRMFRPWDVSRRRGLGFNAVG
jgi:hypothetical protein